MNVKHAPWWIVKPSELKDDEETSFGAETRKRAEEHIKTLKPGGRIKLLNTLENPLPEEDSSYNEEDTFESKRWCIVFYKSVLENEKIKRIWIN